MSHTTRVIAAASSLILLLAFCQVTQAQQQEVVDLEPLLGSAAGSGIGSGLLGNGPLSGGPLGGNLAGTLGSGPLTGTLGSGNLASTFGAGSLASNLGSGTLGGNVRDVFSSVLENMGLPENVIGNIVAPLSNSREAAAAIREMMTNAVGNGPLSSLSSIGNIGPLRTPQESINTINRLMSIDLQQAVTDLSNMMLPSAIRTRTSNNDNNKNNYKPAFGASSATELQFFVPGPLVGLPPSVFAQSAFNAGTGLPAVSAATAADFAAFEAQLEGDLAAQQLALANGILAESRSPHKRNLNFVCGQYALSQFLRSFSQVLVAIDQPLQGILNVLAQFLGVAFSGLTPVGNDYLQAFCCGVVHQSGLKIDLGNGTFQLGGVRFDLADMLAAPKDGKDKERHHDKHDEDDIKDRKDAHDKEDDGDRDREDRNDKDRKDRNDRDRKDYRADVSGLLGGGLLRDGRNRRSPSPPPRQPRVITTPPVCNPVEWLAFALQSNRVLQAQFFRLFVNFLNVKNNLIVSGLRIANVAGNVAANALPLLARQQLPQLAGGVSVNVFDTQQQLADGINVLLNRGG